MVDWKTDELKYSELQADLSVPLLEGLLLNAFDSITITSAEQSSSYDDWPIIFVNAAFETMTGYSQEEALGSTPKMLQGPKTDQEVIARLGRDISEGRIFHGETVNYCKDGSEFVIAWKVVPITDERGEIVQYLAIQRDVTAERHG
jgi:PAS domain S-box-containing protein